MKKDQLCNILLLFFLITGFYSHAQLWVPVSSQKNIHEEKIFRKSTPTDYHLFELKKSEVKSLLQKAPTRGVSVKSNIVIDLPSENGNLKRFELYNAPILDTQIAKRFPLITSFVGIGIDDPTAMARISFSKIGLHAIIFSGNNSTTYIDPYTKDQSIYISYSRNDLPVNQERFTCLVKENHGSSTITKSLTKNANDGQLRTFRLALACTGEYAQFHINNQNIDSNASDQVKKEAVMAAMNVTMTRVNAVFERDLAVTMVLVNNNTDIIFLDSATDNFSNNDGGTMLSQNQTICDNTIGSENYDIGHVFSTGGGGVAYLNSPCTNFKAGGVTGGASPIGDPFDIDFVAHEMGHQFGGNHTQNNNCQRAGSASMEPGSASTIMGYAGICSPNVQNNSDDYFHAINIQEMWFNISQGSSTCGTQSSTNNTAPTANAGSDFTIPASTPFILRGNGSDIDSAGDTLTYCWEQMDPESATMPPDNQSTQGPTFRSLPPTTSPDRYMPVLATVLNGNTASTWEVVPAVSRTMNFRLTVRDNAPLGGGSASDNTVITVDSNSGPFVVTSQNTNETWVENDTKTISWNVANTNITPINAVNVDILLSIDGGLTFPTTLASNVSNDGSHDIIVPGVGNTNEARIMVQGTNHLFYNINTSNFTINSSTLSVDEPSFENFTLWPVPLANTFNVSFKPFSNDPIIIELIDVKGSTISHKEFPNTSSTAFSTSIDCNELTTGIYFVSIQNGNRKYTYKVAKK